MVPNYDLDAYIEDMEKSWPDGQKFLRVWSSLNGRIEPFEGRSRTLDPRWNLLNDIFFHFCFDTLVANRVLSIQLLEHRLIEFGKATFFLKWHAHLFTKLDFTRKRKALILELHSPAARYVKHLRHAFKVFWVVGFSQGYLRSEPGASYSEKFIKIFLPYLPKQADELFFVNEGLEALGVYDV